MEKTVMMTTAATVHGIHYKIKWQGEWEEWWH